MAFEKTWRWFGVTDSIKLGDLKQMGIEGVVTALHHIPNGEVWQVSEILKVRELIEDYGMRWSVVESLPVPEGIKTMSPDSGRLMANYKESLRNLGTCGIDTVTYNFMPVLDWVRTDLHYRLPSGGEVMFFDYPEFVAFDAFILGRPGAENDYPREVVEKAQKIYRSMPAAQAETLARNIILVSQGFIDGVVDGSDRDYKNTFLRLIENYGDIDSEKMRLHLAGFLKEVIPVAEEYGINMCIHPDDPPFPVLGLPRIVSTPGDIQYILDQYDSYSNGFVFCTGSLSVVNNDLLEKIIESFGHRIHFLHLRNNMLLPGNCFHEYGHINGCVDMYRVMKLLLQEQHRRIREGRRDVRMPLRADHGIKMLDDFGRQTNPGYPLIGRMRGLAELTGLEAGIERALLEGADDPLPGG
jgi:mannonate dehydratase